MSHPTLGSWESGYLGTAEYQRDMREARNERTALATAELASQWLALAEGSFAGLAAPGFDIEYPRCSVSGGRDVFGIVPFRVRAIIAAVRRESQSRSKRRAVMTLARVQRETARAAYRRTLPSAAIVSEYRTLSRYPRPLDRYAALDEWCVNRDAHLHGLRQCMSAMPNRDGRGDGDRTAPGVAVNGRETRVQPRWKGTARRDIRTRVGTDETGAPVWGAPDWTCYRVNADGSRTALVSAATATRRKRGRPSNKSRAARTLALQSIAGNIGNVD